jgi:hypothetical protein
MMIEMLYVQSQKHLGHCLSKFEELDPRNYPRAKNSCAAVTGHWPLGERRGVGVGELVGGHSTFKHSSCAWRLESLEYDSQLSRAMV